MGEAACDNGQQVATADNCYWEYQIWCSGGSESLID